VPSVGLPNPVSFGSSAFDIHMIAYGTVRASCLASSAKVTFISQMRA
jgi:hypothetical protein